MINLEAKVLNRVRFGPQKAIDVVKLLGDGVHFSPAMVREVIWELIAQGKLELASDRTLILGKEFTL